MRTTITLDDDTAAKVKAEMRRTGKSMKETLNEALRRGFAQKRALARAQPFRIQARDLGALRPGLNLDNIGALLEQLALPRRVTAAAAQFRALTFRYVRARA